MVGVIGRREAGGGRAPRNPKGDGRFCKNWSVSQWEMGDHGLLKKAMGRSIQNHPISQWEMGDSNPLSSP